MWYCDNHGLWCGWMNIFDKTVNFHIKQSYDVRCKRTFRRGVNDFVDSAVECFLLNIILRVLMTDDVEAVEWRVKGHRDRFAGTHRQRSQVTWEGLQLIDVFLFVISHDKILFVVPERSWNRQQLRCFTTVSTDLRYLKFLSRLNEFWELRLKSDGIFTHQMMQFQRPYIHVM